MMVDLKSCPFCGGNALEFCEDTGSFNCSFCDAHGPCYEYERLPGYDQAAWAWNKRAQPVDELVKPPSPSFDFVGLNDEELRALAIKVGTAPSPTLVTCPVCAGHVVNVDDYCEKHRHFGEVVDASLGGD